MISLTFFTQERSDELDVDIVNVTTSEQIHET